MTTRNPDSGPTDKSMPAERTAMVWPSAIKPSAVASNSMLAILKKER